jgi:hypothetical protein
VTIHQKQNNLQRWGRRTRPNQKKKKSWKMAVERDREYLKGDGKNSQRQEKLKNAMF